MTISSFSNELIVTHFNTFFNLKIIEKCIGWRQILVLSKKENASCLGQLANPSNELGVLLD
ncbi:MAG: hypothetical protein JW740_01140 [Candidatus Zambryskibacteria bacterium]|nr:hypothetical protein [Candidatus Zambryskibacteria bacterium]